MRVRERKWPLGWQWVVEGHRAHAVRPAPRTPHGEQCPVYQQATETLGHRTSEWWSWDLNPSLPGLIQGLRTESAIATLAIIMIIIILINDYLNISRHKLWGLVGLRVGSLQKHSWRLSPPSYLSYCGNTSWSVAKRGSWQKLFTIIDESPQPPAAPNSSLLPILSRHGFPYFINTRAHLPISVNGAAACCSATHHTAVWHWLQPFPCIVGRSGSSPCLHDYKCCCTEHPCTGPCGLRVVILQNRLLGVRWPGQRPRTFKFW